jgi:2-enoate reductase
MIASDVLFTPLKIGSIELNNRIAMAPMGLDYMVNPDGSLNQRVLDYYHERIRHDVGMIICSVFKVENRVEALESCAPMILEPSLEYLSRLCDTAHKYGAKVFVQLTAGYGRVTVPETLRGPCVSASETPNFWDPSIICRSLTVDEIKQIVEAMGDTAKRLLLSGVDGIEFHGHEGYLFDQFTSAIWNHRTDAYGGTLENRLRFPIECLTAIRRQVGNQMVVQYRYGLKHYLKDAAHGALPGELFKEVGRDVAEGLEMATRLENAGFDALHVDAGCYESHYWPHPPYYQKHGCMIDMAARVKRIVTIPVIGVGRLDKPEVAARAVADGLVDVVAIGRGFLADPQWAQRIKSGCPEQIRPCVGCYDGCFGRYHERRHISCALNPASGSERTRRLKPAEMPREVMIIGGGIAGMEAARVAAIRGHRISLYEKSERLGGLVRQAAVPEFKRDLRRLLDWYRLQMDRTGISIFLETEMTPEKIRSASPDVIIAATGAEPIVPAIKGVHGDSVMTAVDLLRNGKVPGDRVVIIGGGLAGCEIAIWLADSGKRTCIIEMLPELMNSGIRVPGQVKMMTLDLLKKYGTVIHTDSRVEEIAPESVTIGHSSGGTDHITADTVVLATGMIPETRLADELADTFAMVHRIGDCREPRNVMNAVWDAYDLARSI